MDKRIIIQLCQAAWLLFVLLAFVCLALLTGVCAAGCVEAIRTWHFSYLRFYLPMFGAGLCSAELMIENKPFLRDRVPAGIQKVLLVLFRDADDV